MSRPAADVRIGVVLLPTRTEGAAVTPAGELLATAEAGGAGDAEQRIGDVLARLLASPAVEPAAVRAVMLGGAWAAAALEDARELGSVAVVRIASPPRSAAPPLSGWPERLRAACCADATIVAGGRDMDGAPLRALDEDALRGFLRRQRGTASAVAIAGTFSAVTPADEEAAGRIAASELPGLPIVLSHELGVLRLLERENATVLNAALIGAGRGIVAALDAALERCGVDAPVYVVRSDGTLLAREHAARFPLLSYAGGVASRLCGAARLAGLEEALVCAVDADGAMLGSVHGGHPREAAETHAIAGVPSSVRIPGTLDVGAPAGQPGRWRRRLEEAIERLQERRGRAPLVVVGARADLVPDELPGVGRVVRVAAGPAAGAVGAALAPIGVTVERVLPRAAAPERRAEIAAEAVALVVQSGADAAATRVVELAEVPLPYLPNSSLCVRARAEGPLQSRARSS